MASSNLLADEVKMDFDVLSVGVKNKICCKVGCTDVVTVKDGNGGERNI